jgi:hypothetical protein
MRRRSALPLFPRGALLPAKRRLPVLGRSSSQVLSGPDAEAARVAYAHGVLAAADGEARRCPRRAFVCARRRFDTSELDE